MSEVWFTNSTPVRGVCIYSWSCDAEGKVIREKAPLSSNGDVNIVMAVKDLAQSKDGSNGRTSQIATLSVSEVDSSLKEGLQGLSDKQMISKLELLISDAKDAFQTVLRRNLDLEKELDDIREAKVADSGVRGPASFPSPFAPRCANNPLSVPPLNLPVNSGRRLFDISTPPSYKDTTAPTSANSRRPSLDSGRIRKGLSVFNG